MRILFVLLLASCALAYIEVPEMAAVEYPEGAEVKNIALVDTPASLDFDDFAVHGVKQVILDPENASYRVKLLVYPGESAAPEGIKFYKVSDISTLRFNGTMNLTLAVSKKWISGNKMIPSDLLLYSFETGEWKQTYIKERYNDTNYIYLKVFSSPIVSYAVGIYHTEKVVVVPEVIVNNTQKEPSKKAKVASDDTPMQVFIILALAFAFMVSMTILNIYRHRKTDK